MPFHHWRSGAEHENARSADVVVRRGCVAARADVANHVTARDTVAFLQAGSVAFQVRVVVAEAPARIETDRSCVRPAWLKNSLAIVPAYHRVNGACCEAPACRRLHADGRRFRIGAPEISLQRLDIHIVQGQPQVAIANLRDSGVTPGRRSDA